MSKCTHIGREYDSITEACVAAWLYEACALGYIEDYQEQVQYALSPRKVYTVQKYLKTKVRVDERTLLQEANYTADFVLFSMPKDTFMYTKLNEAGMLPAGYGGYDSEYTWDDRHIYVVDVKGERCPASQASKFSLTQKFLHAATGIYVNKLVPCARKPSAKRRSFFMLCGLPSELPQECWLNDGSDFRQPWRDMFVGCPSIEEALG